MLDDSDGVKLPVQHFSVAKAAASQPESDEAMVSDDVSMQLKGRL